MTLQVTGLQHSKSSFSDLKHILSQNPEIGDTAAVPHQIKSRTHMLCSSFLGGIWKNIAVEDLVLSRMKGGMSNMLFLCKLPDHISPKNGEPDKVLLRIYFNPETENHLVAESVIFTLLSEKKLGPKLFGIFNGGRLEEYIVSRPLTVSEIRDSTISQRIARKLATVHKLHVPITKEPTYICDALNRWLCQLTNYAKQTSAKLKWPLQLRLANGKVRLLSSVHDLAWEFEHAVIKCLTHSNSPVVFCHNDLQEGNILLPLEQHDTPKDLVFIDFEYASYNYRAFDFANHFCEWAIDYACDEAPYFLVCPEHETSKQQQAHFLKAYLEASGLPSDDQAVERVLDEVDSFLPISHFFWGVWALLQVELSPVHFGFGDYAKHRLSLYFDRKPRMMELMKKEVKIEVNGDMMEGVISFEVGQGVHVC